MSCLVPPPLKKRKHKIKENKGVQLKSLNKKWASCNIDPDVAFGNGTSCDGFMDLEELDDYDEDEIKAMTQKKSSYKKR